MRNTFLAVLYSSIPLFITPVLADEFTELQLRMDKNAAELRAVSRDFEMARLMIKNAEMMHAKLLEEQNGLKARMAIAQREKAAGTAKGEVKAKAEKKPEEK